MLGCRGCAEKTAPLKRNCTPKPLDDSEYGARKEGREILFERWFDMGRF